MKRCRFGSCHRIHFCTCGDQKLNDACAIYATWGSLCCTMESSPSMDVGLSRIRLKLQEVRNIALTATLRGLKQRRIYTGCTQIDICSLGVHKPNDLLQWCSVAQKFHENLIRLRRDEDISLPMFQELNLI
jgi:hypothetical protein